VNEVVVFYCFILKDYLTFKGNHKQYSTALRKITSMVLLKHGINDGNIVYVPKDTILNEMASKIEKVKPAFLLLT
jgi:hypothetical protein